jgi:hypothetical protein
MHIDKKKTSVILKMQIKKKKKNQEPRKNKKQELCPLVKWPSPQVLHNECIHKKYLSNENQNPKKVETIKKKENRGLEKHNAEEREIHCPSD